MKISGVVITYNEAQNISQCLHSLEQVVDEIIVVDSYSEDETPQICERFPAVRFIQRVYDGQIEQKNFALRQAQNTWILALDGDEVLSNELIEDIKAIGTPESIDAYEMKRLTNYCGKWIRHGGWYPDRKIRLWNKESATWGGSNPHDRVVPHSPHRLGRLKGHILHYGFSSVQEHQGRIDEYARMGAFSLRDQPPLRLYFGMIFSPLIKFIRDYFLRLGFVDGCGGWHIARLSMISKYKKYRYACELSGKKDP